MSPDLDAALLRTFLACVRAGSVSRAARSLGRTQPALSQQLRRLEDIVGAPLLRRSGAGVAATHAGERLASYAERILALSAEAVHAVGRQRRLSGRCGVGLLEDLATPVFSRALTEFAARHPEVTLEIATLPGPDMRRAFDDGRIQLVLGDVSYLDHPVVRTVSPPLVWAASPTFDATQTPLPLVLFSQPCRWREPVLRSLDAAGRPWRVAFESTGLTGVIAGAQAGLGAASLMPANVGPELVALGPATGLPPLPEVEIGLVRRFGAEGDPLLDAVQDLLEGLL